MSRLVFRRAVPADAPALDSVAFAAKAHWGYDAAFMARVRPFLAPSPERIAEMLFTIVEEEGEVLGFYGIGTERGAHWLFDMWVKPERIGSGLGRRLWEHLAKATQAAGLRPFFIESDPNAEGFYLRMGAVRAGEVIAEGTGRTLPLLRYD